jgi:hypothetical protein
VLALFSANARLGSASLRTADVLLGKVNKDVSFALRRLADTRRFAA